MKKNNNLNKFNYCMENMDIIKFNLIEFIIGRKKGFERKGFVIGKKNLWDIGYYDLIILYWESNMDCKLRIELDNEL